MERKPKTRKKSPGKKMTQDQLALAIAKKRETDSKALRIVEKLIEPNIEVDFLLENLKDINKCHMDDVIEERAITKLCGYVLCDNPVIINTKQQYSISLKMNKVYDITKRKNFCSSNCYGAANFLLEQMLESPLWMRDKEVVPKFKLLAKENQKSSQSCGDEVSLLDHKQEILKKQNISKDEKETSSKNQNVESEEIEPTSCSMIQEFSEKDINHCDKMDFDEGKQKPVENLSELVKNYQKKTNELTTSESRIKTVDETVSVKNKLKIDEETLVDNGSKKVSQKTIVENQINESDEKINVEDRLKKGVVKPLIQDDKRPPVQDIIKEVERKSLHKEQSEKAKTINIQNRLQSIAGSSKPERKDIQTLYVNLVSNIEKNIYTWITRETILLLFGDNNEKQKIVNEVKHKITQQDIYNALIKKIDKLELEEEQEEQEILWNSRPLPDYAEIEEEGNKLQIKVNTLEKESNHQVPESKKIEESYVPLQEARAPNTFRRKILMDKLDKIVPNLIQTLTGTMEAYQKSQLYSRTQENLPTIKVLVNTFNLSSKNVIFRTAEWNLVGLIVLKMISLFDPWIQKVIGTKQASQFTSMILMSHKLEPNYLDLFISSIKERFNNV